MLMRMARESKWSLRNLHYKFCALIENIPVPPIHGILMFPFTFLHWNINVTVTLLELRGRRQRPREESTDHWPGDLESCLLFCDAPSLHLIVFDNEVCWGCFPIFNDCSQWSQWLFPELNVSHKGKPESINVLTKVNKILFCWFEALFGQCSRPQHFFWIIDIKSDDFWV